MGAAPQAGDIVKYTQKWEREFDVLKNQRGQRFLHPKRKRESETDDGGEVSSS